MDSMWPACAIGRSRRAEEGKRDFSSMDKLPPKRLAKSIPVIPSRAERTLGVTVLLFGFGTLSALKGLNLMVSSTASYFYHTDYRFGFILRGLVGQFFSPI